MTSESKKTLRIALDAMGGDFAPGMKFSGRLKFSKKAAKPLKMSKSF